MYSHQPTKTIMEGLRPDKSDLFFTAYGQPDHTHTAEGPRAKKVSFDGGIETHTPFTPPDSPVFAELTNAGQVDRKPNLAKLNSFQDGARAVPNLEMNTSITDYYMNTVYSSLQPLSPSFEGSICDDPLGASNNVLVKQELPDTYPDVFSVAQSPLDMSMVGGEQASNLQQQFFDWPSQTVSVFEAPAHPQIKEEPEYSTVPSPTPSYDSGLGSMSAYQSDNTLSRFSHLRMGGREHLNSGGEDADYDDSCSEASFDLTTTGNSEEDSLDGITPFDPTKEFQPYRSKSCVAPRTHNYKRNTINQSVAMLGRSHNVPSLIRNNIPKVATAQNAIKKRGRPRKALPSVGSDGGLGRRGRGRREAMKGNHLWEFIRDLLKDENCSPKFIRWEEKDDGVFRFVNSEAVAQMWGRKKNNPAMTYEKLSRAMRYYYKRDILERVDGRRLVYKFGKNAVGWKQAAGLPNESLDKST